MYVITVSYGLVTGKAKRYPYYQPAMYKDYLTADGTEVWKYVCHLGNARRSTRLAKKDALEFVPKYKNCAYIDGIRQYRPITEEHLEILNVKP